MARTKEFDRETVLDRAMQLFWCKGYEATSMQDLVEGMGIGRGSLYDTFGDKHRLYLAALERYERLHSSAMIDALAAPGSARAAIARVFAAAVDEALADVEGRGCMMVNAAVELAARDRETATRVAGNRCQIEAAFSDAVRRGQESGEIASRHSPEALARFLFAALNGLRVTAKAEPKRAVLEDVAHVALASLE